MKPRNHLTEKATIATAKAHCKICQTENDVISFKNQCICEACVAYIKGNC